MNFPIVIEHLHASDSKRQKRFFIITTIHGGNDFDSTVSYRVVSQRIPQRPEFQTTSFQRAWDYYEES